MERMNTDMKKGTDPDPKALAKMMVAHPQGTIEMSQDGSEGIRRVDQGAEEAHGVDRQAQGLNSLDREAS
jgi:hypothetical protein